MMSKGALERGVGTYIRFSHETKQVREHERNNVVFVGYMHLEKAYDRVNREGLRQVLRMYVVMG